LALPLYDLTARKAHQWAMVALIAAGFLATGTLSVVLIALAGAIMLLGRLWWPFDIVRQVVWRALEPWGILIRREAHEDRETRRIARTLGGIIWLGAALLLGIGFSTIAWVLAGLIAAMVVLDATVDFCALCFIFSQLERRGLLPAAVGYAPGRSVYGE
jgi:hypothetical protein